MTDDSDMTKKARDFIDAFAVRPWSPEPPRGVRPLPPATRLRSSKGANLMEDSKNGLQSSTIWSIIGLSVAVFGPSVGLSDQDAQHIALGTLAVTGVIGRVRKGDIHFTPNMVRNALGAVASAVTEAALRRGGAVVR